MSPVQFRNKLAVKTKELSREHTRLVYAKLIELGYKIKETKSHLEPMQELDHLGFHINTRLLQEGIYASAWTSTRRRDKQTRTSKTSGCSMGM